MKTIKYKGKEYPIRTFMVKWPSEDPDTEMQITIGVDSLNEAYSRGTGCEVDQLIYFYVPDEDINRSAKDICENYLDEKFILVKEEI